jgi:hypothetical protein
MDIDATNGGFHGGHLAAGEHQAAVHGSISGDNRHDVSATHQLGGNIRDATAPKLNRCGVLFDKFCFLTHFVTEPLAQLAPEIVEGFGVIRWFYVRQHDA